MARGPVWWPLPQTSQFAEHMARAVLTQYVSSPCQVWTDCSSVKTFYSKPLRARLAGSSKFAGICRDTLSYSGSTLIDTLKVKAHVKPQAATCFWDLCAITGNSLVDILAKLAATADEPATSDRGHAACKSMNMARSIAKVFAFTLAMFPPIPFERKHFADMRPRLLVCHEWIQHGSIWRCESCMSYAMSLKARRDRDLQPCRPEASGFICRMAKASGSHLTCKAVYDGQPFFFCARCAAYAHLQVRDLVSKCTPLKGGARTSLTRMLAGMHPITKVAFDDFALPDRAHSSRISAIFDRVRARSEHSS